jgi:hypothetical protein
VIPQRYLGVQRNAWIFLPCTLVMLAALPRAGAIGLAVALASAKAVLPAAAQHEQKPSAKAGGAAVGLPVFSSDGKRIGKVLATGIDEDNQPVLVAEIERRLGFGSAGVAIPTNLFVVKAGRIELTITADEVAGRLARSQGGR